MGDREAAIQAAIADLNSGVFSSQRAAAQAYNIAQSTLSTRVNGRAPHRAAHQHLQRLSPDQEDFLADWIIDQDMKGYPPSHARAREMAIRILRLNGDTQPLGKRWIQGFITRNPRVNSIIGRKIEAPRAEAATPEQIRAFFELFEAVRTRLNIRLEDIWNMDKTGTALGVCANSRVLASSSKKKAYMRSPENREWVSIIDCVSAIGRKLRCAIIFKGQSLQTTWFLAESVPDWLYTTSENGWTSKDIGAEWLQRIYIPETAPDTQQYRLLLLDGHSSHVDIEFMWLCKINRIELLFLPPHSTHLLQPLDLSGFSVIKSKYRNQIRDLSSLDDAAPIKKNQFIRYYYIAREEGLSERIIRAGWRAAGLVPYNPNLVIQSSQMLNRLATPEQPNQLVNLIDPVYSTPRRPQDIYIAQQALLQSENLSRSARVLLSKAGKAIAIANTRAAAQEAEISRLNYQLSTLSSTRKKKRIWVDQNQRFADIKAIKAAINQAATQKAPISRSTVSNTASAINRAAATPSFADMCTQFQI